MEQTVTNDTSHAAPVRPQRRAGAHAAPPRQVTSQLSASLPTLEIEDTPQQSGTPVITFDHVTKVYPAQPNKPALNDVSLQIFAGEFVFLVGHSGSGKTTFIRMLIREVKPTQGHIYIADEDLANMRNWRVPYLRRNIGCVFQDFKLLPNKTVFENVAFALEVIGKSRHVIKTQVPEVSASGRPARQAQQAPRPAFRRRAAARVHRACHREPSSASLSATSLRATLTRRPPAASWTCSSESTAPAPPWSWQPMTARWWTTCVAALSRSTAVT